MQGITIYDCKCILLVIFSSSINISQGLTSFCQSHYIILDRKTTSVTTYKCKVYGRILDRMVITCYDVKTTSRVLVYIDILCSCVSKLCWKSWKMPIADL